MQYTGKRKEKKFCTKGRRPELMQRQLLQEICSQVLANDKQQSNGHIVVTLKHSTQNFSY